MGVEYALTALTGQASRQRPACSPGVRAQTECSTSFRDDCMGT